MSRQVGKEDPVSLVRRLYFTFGFVMSLSFLTFGFGCIGRVKGVGRSLLGVP